jgi:hypothetical protein
VVFLAARARLTNVSRWKNVSLNAKSRLKNVIERSASGTLFCAKFVKNDNYFAYVKKSSNFAVQSL